MLCFVVFCVFETKVIPGSHKVAVTDRQAIIDAAYGDPENLIYTVVAPPGSTLLFGTSRVNRQATATVTMESKQRQAERLI